MPTYKDINLLTKKATMAGTEKIPVSDTEYITPDQIIGAEETLTPIEMTSGRYYYIVPAVIGQVFSEGTQPNANYRYAKIPCSPGDNFILNVTTGDGSGNILFCDANLVALSKEGAVNYTNKRIIAPQNAAYLYLNDASGRTSYKSVLGRILAIEQQISELESEIGDIASILASI